MNVMKWARLAPWCLAQLTGMTLSIYTFFIWAPWLGSRSHDETVALYGAAGVPDCDAIAVNHSHYFCMSWGTVSSNPWGFALCTAILISGVAFFSITQHLKKGLSSPELAEPESQRLISTIVVVSSFAAVYLISAVVSYFRS